MSTIIKLTTIILLIFSTITFGQEMSYTRPFILLSDISSTISASQLEESMDRVLLNGDILRIQSCTSEPLPQPGEPTEDYSERLEQWESICERLEERKSAREEINQMENDFE